jgi:hypothetical protein
MNLAKRTSVFSLAAIMVLTMTSSIVLGQDRGSSNANERTIVGAWRTIVTGRNCQTGDPLGTLKGLFTFNEGGTMSEYGIGAGASPALRSPGHGVWERDPGWQDYSIAFTYYRYDANGVLIGSQKVKAALHLGTDGDEFTTSSTIEILDANDNLVATGCGTAAGTRFK